MSGKCWESSMDVLVRAVCLPASAQVCAVLSSVVSESWQSFSEQLRQWVAVFVPFIWNGLAWQGEEEREDRTFDQEDADIRNNQGNARGTVEVGETGNMDEGIDGGRPSWEVLC